MTDQIADALTPEPKVTLSDRGFEPLDPIPSEYGGAVTVYESSAAEAPHIWVRVTSPADLNSPEGAMTEGIAIFRWRVRRSSERSLAIWWTSLARSRTVNPRRRPCRDRSGTSGGNAGAVGVRNRQRRP